MSEKVRSELEKREIADWSRKTAAKQLLEMALREKQETELLRKNFRGVFGEELEECRFGIIAVYGKRKKTSVAKFRKNTRASVTSAKRNGSVCCCWRGICR